MEATNQVLNKKLEKQQETLTRYQKEVIPQKEYQELLQKFKALTFMEDETYANLRVAKKKVQYLKSQLEKAT